MKTNLISLKIRKIIFHDVPRRIRGGQPVTPELTDIEAILDPQTSSYFKEKLISNIQSSHAFPVEYDPRSHSPIPSIVRALTIDSENDFVKLSQQVALHLCNIQGASNPAGLVAAAICSVGVQSTVAIFKMERERGGRVIPDVNADGKKYFKPTVLTDLVLTEKTKVFKNALFVRLGDADDAFEIAVCDNQTRVGADNEIAQFFLRFLGCRFVERPRVLTKRYFDNVSVFINTKIADPLLQFDCYTHLHAQLTSQTGIVSPVKYRDECLPLPLRDEFVKFMAERSTSMKEFALDTASIQAQLRREIIQMRSGVTISAPRGAAKKHIAMVPLEGKLVRVEITDELRRLGR